MFDNCRLFISFTDVDSFFFFFPLFHCPGGRYIVHGCRAFDERNRITNDLTNVLIYGYFGSYCEGK